VLASGARGRGFESRHSDHSPDIVSPRLSRVIKAVAGFHAKCRSGGVTDRLFAELKIVAEMLQEDYTPAEMSAVLSAPELAIIKTELPLLVARMETELEKAEGQKQLARLAEQGARAFDDFILYDKYKNLVRKEWLLYQKLHTDEELRGMRFLFAGCGGMPLTAIGMAKTYGVRVDCCDVDAEACRIASGMIERLGLQGQMRVTHESALKIDYSPYDVVIVANLVQPQLQALARISSFENVRAVIVRRVNGLVSFMYSGVNPEGLRPLGLELAATADPNDRTSVHQSVLLRRCVA
jgi:hypothetical protein